MDSRKLGRAAAGTRSAPLRTKWLRRGRTAGCSGGRRRHRGLAVGLARPLRRRAVRLTQSTGQQDAIPPDAPLPSPCCRGRHGRRPVTAQGPERVLDRWGDVRPPCVEQCSPQAVRCQEHGSFGAAPSSSARSSSPARTDGRRQAMGFPGGRRSGAPRGRSTQVQLPAIAPAQDPDESASLPVYWRKRAMPGSQPPHHCG